MRIKINLSKSTHTLPIVNNFITTSFINKCLGESNEFHDSKNDYCISTIIGGKLIKGTTDLSFENGGYFTITSNNNDFFGRILTKIYSFEFYNDIKITGIDFIEETFYNGWNYFKTLTPFIIKDYSDKHTYNFITLNDDDFSLKVKNYLIKKLSKIDNTLDLKDFDVVINKHDKHKVKRIVTKNVKNLANQCQINIHTNKKVAELIYNIGLGQSTGYGFGTIFKTENKFLYGF